MNAPSSTRFETLLERLASELDESSAGVRVTKTWKEVQGVVEEHEARRAEIVEDPDALDTAIRVLEAQVDLLDLTREEVAEQERIAERERERREREDRTILDINRNFLKPYSVVAVLGIVLVPVLGLPFAEWVLVAALPGVLGFLEMRRRRQLMEGRNWVILNDVVRQLAERIRLYDILALVGVGLAIGAFVLVKVTGWTGG